ncbi:MAG: TetR family transcriptional regulator, partial [Comamonadaceae bacterium]
MARRTKEEALATRHRLIDAAEVLFQSQGVSQTSLQQIAEQAGATRGAIYWHFKDKADLFNAMMERVTLPMESAVRIGGTSEHDPLTLIETGMVHALRLVTDDPQVRRVFEVAMHKVE